MVLVFRLSNLSFQIPNWVPRISETFRFIIDPLSVNLKTLSEALTDKTQNYTKMASKRQKWKGSAEKAGRMSRESLTDSRKSSVLGEETSANELAEYLETLKKKSGIKSLWKGESFDRVVRDEEDKTPDISISSMDDEIGEPS